MSAGWCFVVLMGLLLADVVVEHVFPAQYEDGACDCGAKGDMDGIHHAYWCALYE